jgi:hypothetical protein
VTSVRMSASPTELRTVLQRDRALIEVHCVQRASVALPACRNQGDKRTNVRNLPATGCLLLCHVANATMRTIVDDLAHSISIEWHITVVQSCASAKPSKC